MKNRYKFYINSGKGQSKYQLVSFDEALRDMDDLQDYNLIKISSILPAYSQRENQINIPKGSFIPTAYSHISSNIPGDKISSAVGVAIPTNPDDVGVIMEFSSHCSQQEAEEIILNMLNEAMNNRQRSIQEIIISANETTIPKDNREVYTTLVSAIAIWPSN